MFKISFSYPKYSIYAESRDETLLVFLEYLEHNKNDIRIDKITKIEKGKETLSEGELQVWFGPKASRVFRYEVQEIKVFVPGIIEKHLTSEKPYIRRIIKEYLKQNKSKAEHAKSKIKKKAKGS